MQIDKGSVTWRVTPDLLGILDSAGLFRHTNPAWKVTLGYMPEEIESRPFLEFLHPDDVERTQEAFLNIQRGIPALKFENRYRHVDGSYRWLSWNAIPDGIFYFCNARDVTVEKQNEAALKTREEEARFREQFIAVLGHDLRNPVAAVGSALRLISHEPQSEKAQEYIAASQQSLGRMAHLISDVMDFARARLGGGLAMTLENQPDMKSVLEHTVEEIRMAHRDVQIVEEYDFAEMLRVDPDRIAQLLSNLLSNAVTHGADDQPIHVAAREVGNDFVLSVSNRGNPIPAQAMSMLFAPFTRADAREAQQGLGLGLFIARKIAAGHHGTLSVTSDAEKTVFTFTMPLAQ